MKFGFRTPSWKRSFSAMTRGAATRALKKAILPGYGQKGKSYYTGFKKSAYNKVYNLTTVSVFDFFKTHKQRLNSSLNKIADDLKKAEKELSAISIYNRGLGQYDIIKDFVEKCGNEPLNKSIQKAVQRVRNYSRRYLNKSASCGVDLYTFTRQEIEKLKESAIRGTTRYECGISIDIINQLEQQINHKHIIEDIKTNYIEKHNSDFHNTDNHEVFPEELVNNPNWFEEGESQLKVIEDLSSKISNSGLNLHAVNLKILNFVVKYYGVRKKNQINLYDYLEYELTQKLNASKRDVTKFEYNQALNIIKMLKNDISIDDIYKYLKNHKE